MADPLVVDRSYRVGDRGRIVRLVQEWLCLHGIAVLLDGEFGPATAAAVRAFQQRLAMQVTGVVDDATFAALVAPVVRSTAALAPDGGALGSLVVRHAMQHLTERPREVGGQNRGPWVRLYMDGHEGPSWAWCAGFVCFILAQACASLGVAMPVAPSFSCDVLARNARDAQRLFSQPSVADRSRVTPGSVFLLRRTASDWTHTGIVVRAEQDHFVTIEGNTNDAGEREGYEVCERYRGYDAKDFIAL